MSNQQIIPAQPNEYAWVAAVERDSEKRVKNYHCMRHRIIAWEIDFDNVRPIITANRHSDDSLVFIGIENVDGYVAVNTDRTFRRPHLFAESAFYGDLRKQCSILDNKPKRNT